MNQLTKDEIINIQNLHAYILANLNTTLELNSLCRIAGMSKHKLNKGFVKEYGVKVIPFIHKKKMELARELLTKSDKTLKEIAFTVAYRHTKNFFIAFKKHFGVTAGSLRKG